jgi:hypothetical protein
VAHPNLLGFQIYVAYVFKDILGIYWGCIWDINVLTYYINIYYNTDTYTLGYLGSWSPISFFLGGTICWRELPEWMVRARAGPNKKKKRLSSPQKCHMHEHYEIST